MPSDLRSEFGDIDIYLFDLLLRGHLHPSMTVLDAGCGTGRNLRYLLRNGFTVYAADLDAASVEAVQALAARVSSSLPQTNFRVEPIEAMSFPDECADLVISSAVLHFARDDEHFLRMLEGTWRPLKRDGILFCRLASSVGIEDRVRPVGGGRFALPDGSERYLVTERRLLELTVRMGGTLLGPLKTTVVHGQRSMSTWLVRRSG